jgi:putative transposase
VVHEVRQSIRYVNYKDRKPVARDLRSVYTAANAEQALLELQAFDSKWGVSTR